MISTGLILYARAASALHRRAMHADRCWSRWNEMAVGERTRRDALPLGDDRKLADARYDVMFHRADYWFSRAGGDMQSAAAAMVKAHESRATLRQVKESLHAE